MSLPPECGADPIYDPTATVVESIHFIASNLRAARSVSLAARSARASNHANTFPTCHIERPANRTGGRKFETRNHPPECAFRKKFCNASILQVDSRQRGGVLPPGALTRSTMKRTRLGATGSILILIAAVTSCGPVSARVLAQPCAPVETKITASDASAGDVFGHSVAISGNMAIVGAVLGESAYLFDVTTGEQLHKLIASDTTASHYFGGAVAISGNLAIVGATGDRHAGEGSGAAYVFDVTTGAQLLKLTASDAAPNQGFGSSVALSGNTAIIGAVDLNSYVDTGAAYLFDVTTGMQLHKLNASDAAAGDQFGFSVSISGGRAIVGAKFDNDAGIHSGSAYVFGVATGEQLLKLTASDGAEADQFGFAVAISSSTAVVSAVGDDAYSFSGSAYLFDVVTGTQLHKLTASDAAADDFFGSAVAISGSTAVVGAVGDDDGGSFSGSAYLFDVATGAQLHKLTASDAAAFDFFGGTVAISGDTAVVGARDTDDAGASSGAAYLFDAKCPVKAVVDIKPGACPNTFNRAAHGVLPVSVLGTADLDVGDIDISTVRLIRADGVRGSVAPNEGPSGSRPTIEDIGAPNEGPACTCHDSHGDGKPDLSLKFSIDKLAADLSLDDQSAGAIVDLVVVGTLRDGRSFAGSDCISLVPRGRQAGQGM